MRRSLTYFSVRFSYRLTNKGRIPSSEMYRKKKVYIRRKWTLKRFTLPISTLLMKVVSVIRCWKNGVILSVDNLELSIISNTPFAVGFLERILNIKKSQKAPFGAISLSMIELKHIRNMVNLLFAVDT